MLFVCSFTFLSHALTRLWLRRAALFGGQQQGEGGAGGAGGWGNGGAGGARGGGSGGGYADGETDVTIALDNLQLVQQQRSVMKRASCKPPGATCGAHR